MVNKMLELIRHYQKQDPVQPTILEVILVYPGFHAVLLHQFNHWLWQRKLRLLSRILAHFTRFVTGIEIHPAAQIGRNLFIDHGMGIVIGETTVIGNNVTIFHQVTLGGLGIPTSAHQKRHPNIGNNVILGAGAKILGNITVHNNAKIGPNSVVMNDVPAYASFAPSPSRITKYIDDWTI